MIKKLSLILIVSLLVSVVDILYINSSPLLGEADLDEMMLDYEKIKVFDVDVPKRGYLTLSTSTDVWGDYVLKSNELYAELYQKRPHIKDENKAYYKLLVLGYGIQEVMFEGIIFWKISIFNPEKCEFLGNFSDPTTYMKFTSRYAPRALKSEFYPGAGLHRNPISTPDDPYLKDWGYGRKSLFMPYGWFILAEMIGGNSFILFDERFPCELNISHREFMEGYTELWRVSFARLSFLESVLDEKPPWRGIYYLTYYPNFERIWIVTKSIPREEIENSKILIDGKEVKKEVMFPFTFVDAELDDGEHNLELITPSKTYSTDFYVDLSPLWIFSTSIRLRTDGNFTFSMANIDPENRTISLENIIVAIDDSEIRKDMDVNMELYNLTQIYIDLQREFEFEEYIEANVTINYIIDNQEKEYKTTITAFAED